MIAFTALIEESPVGDTLGSLLAIPFPALADLPALDISELAQPQFIGAWWLVGIALISSFFNYFLGEELLFRGVLLPRMRGAFGRWDWIANAMLFVAYHLIRPLTIIPIAVASLAWTWTSRRYRSIWFAIIVHGIEGIVILAGVLAVVSGLAF